MPKVAIVVLFYKNPQDVDDCLGSLVKLNYPKEDYDIIAIDNFSQDETAAKIRQNYSGKVILIETDKNLGYAGGNNIGVDYALRNGFNYVYILNPDTEVEPDFLIKSIKLAQSSQKIGIVQSKILLHQDKNKIQTSGNKIHFTGIAYSGDFDKEDDLGSDPYKIAYASGAGMLVKADVFKTVGKFNQKYFMYHEDVDLGWLAWLYGFEVYTEPSSVVYHKYSFSKNKQKYFWMERNRWWVILKNYKLATLLVLLPVLLVLEFMLFVYAMINGWFMLKIKSCFSFWAGVGDVLKERRVVQKGRKISDAEFLNRVTDKLEFSGMTEGGLIKLVNKFFRGYLKIVRKIVFW